MRLFSRSMAVEELVRLGRANVRANREPISLKRLMDVTGALAALGFFGPAMLIIYALLKLSGGKPIFAHMRVGRFGEIFPCFKFRTMVTDSDRVLQEYLGSNVAARAEWESNFKLTKDPRVTRFGMFLRRSSLDELPQLLNVLRGEMSLVGPRPIVASEVERYADKIEVYYTCRPGLTGLWQVSGRNNVDYRTRVRLDTYYARRRTVSLDVVILVRTVWAVVSCRGAR
jgi:lipopolysaccharide/colanic/teichoic acid biosynthesis glycosyltransferase